MKGKIFMLIIGMLIGAIITATGFLMFGGNKGKRDFDPSKFKDGDMTPPNFSRDKEDIDFNNIDPNNLPEKPSKVDKNENNE